MAMKKTGPQIIKVQLSAIEVARAESLREWAANQVSICPTGTASRTAVLREAVRRGLDSIEREMARDANG